MGLFQSEKVMHLHGPDCPVTNQDGDVCALSCKFVSMLRESVLQELLSLQSNRHVLSGREPKEHL